MRVACRSIYHKQDQLEKGDSSNSNTDIRTYLKTLLFSFFWSIFFVLQRKKLKKRKKIIFNTNEKKKRNKKLHKNKEYIRIYKYAIILNR